jgi:hypothetical protein
MVQIMILRSESQTIIRKRKQINKSFLGFKYSGEGYNGEYPFEGKWTNQYILQLI